MQSHRYYALYLKCVSSAGTEELLTNFSSRAKADMKKEKDPFVLAVLDGRQLALKVSANRCGVAAVVRRLSVKQPASGSTDHCMIYSRSILQQKRSVCRL